MHQFPANHGSKLIVITIIIIDLLLPPGVPAEAISSEISKWLLDMQATKEKGE